MSSEVIVLGGNFPGIFVLGDGYHLGFSSGIIVMRVSFPGVIGQVVIVQVVIALIQIKLFCKIPSLSLSLNPSSIYHLMAPYLRQLGGEH